MFGNRRSRGCLNSLLGLMVTLSIAVVGVFFGLLFYLWTSVKNAFGLPITLDKPKPYLSRVLDGESFGVISIIGVFSTFILCAIGIVCVSSDSFLLGLVSFTGALVAGYFTLHDLQRHNGPLQTAPQAEAIPTSRVKAYVIRLPYLTVWEPELAYRFMEQILDKVRGRLTFRIVAEKGQISWQIIDLQGDIEPFIIIQAVGALYPDAEVKANSFRLAPLTTPFYRQVLHYKHAADFVGPIRYVTDLKQLDPLVALTQEMTNLQTGERIIYTLFVSGSANFARRQGERLITTSTIRPWEFLYLRGWLGLIAKFVTGYTRRERFVSTDQSVFREKLNHQLYQCFLMLQVDAPTRHRVYQLMLLESHLHQLANVPYNALVQGAEFTPDSIQYIETMQTNWVTSCLGLIDAWLKNVNLQWINYRLILELRELTSLWHLPHDKFTAPNILWSRSRQVQMPSVMVGKHKGICLGLNRYAGKEEQVYLPDENRNTHVAIIGMTGTGKSTLLHHLIDQDLRQGKGVAVVDPHGNLVRDILQTSIPQGREQDVVVLDLSNPDYPPPLNPLRGRLGPVAAGQVLNIIERLFPDTIQYARLSRYLRAALELLHCDPQATMLDLERLFIDTDYRDQLLAKCLNDEVALTWQDYAGSSRGEQSQIRDPILNRINPFYGGPEIKPILCHPDSLDFKEFIRQKKILLISLKMDEEFVAEQERNLLGALLISRLQFSGMKNAAAPYYIYIDEVQKFVTTSLETMFSEARKFGLSLTVANQYLKQLAGPTLEAIIGNVGALAVFQCGLDDAQVLTPYMRPNFQKENLINLDMHQAVVKMRFGKETQPAFSLVTRKPLTTLSPREQAEAEKRERCIRDASVQTYTPKSRTEVLQWLKDHYQRSNNQGPVDYEK